MIIPLKILNYWKRLSSKLKKKRSAKRYKKWGVTRDTDLKGIIELVDIVDLNVLAVPQIERYRGITQNGVTALPDAAQILNRYLSIRMK